MNKSREKNLILPMLKVSREVEAQVHLDTRAEDSIDHHQELELVVVASVAHSITLKEKLMSLEDLLTLLNRKI